MASFTVASAAPKQGKGKGEELPDTPARLWVVAPAAKGPWLLRIDNEGDVPIRIPADVRLLRFEVRPLEKGKWRRRPKVCDGPEAFGLTRKFPHRRETVLAPGQSFVEQFDPRMICFGKQAKMLTGGALVKPTFGWKPRPKWSRRKEKPPFAADTAKRPRQSAPLKRLEAPTMLLSYAKPSYPVDAGTTGAAHTPETAPKSGTDAATTAGATEAAAGKGRHGRKGRKGGKGRKGRGKRRGGNQRNAAGAQPPTGSSGAPAAQPASAAPGEGEPESVSSQLQVPDELAAQLAVDTSQYSDARHPRDIVVSLSAKNAGERPRRVALRRRQLSFTVIGPDGVRKCARRSMHHVIPPDLFRKLSQGNKVRMQVQLAELCPRDTFRRAGVYVVTPTLHATERDREQRVDALTGVVSSRDPKPGPPPKKAQPDKPRDPEDDSTLVRVKRGQDPFYRREPVMVPTRFFKIGEEAYRREQQAEATK